MEVEAVKNAMLAKPAQLEEAAAYKGASRSRGSGQGWGSGQRAAQGQTMPFSRGQVDFGRCCLRHLSKAEGTRQKAEGAGKARVKATLKVVEPVKM